LIEFIEVAKRNFSIADFGLQIEDFKKDLESNSVFKNSKKTERSD